MSHWTWQHYSNLTSLGIYWVGVVLIYLKIRYDVKQLRKANEDPIKAIEETKKK